MSKSRKTDKGRLKEKRGQGYGVNYKPWIWIHEIPSKGRSHRVLGWKNRRVHHFLSDGEFYVFLILQNQDNVLDIREQFPLLPLEETLDIAKQYGIAHPPKTKREKTVITSDFNILVKTDVGIKEIVRTVKREEDYFDDERTLEKFFIEKEYWRKRGIDWGVILHTEESKVIGRNLHYIYQDYFWNDDKNLKPEELSYLIEKFKETLVKNNYEVLKAVSSYEEMFCLDKGEGLNFFKFLLAQKIIKTDFRVKFNFFDMKVWF